MTGIEGFFSFYAKFAPEIACIWFAVWGIRRKSEVDYPLDRSAKIVRWIVVTLGFILGYFVPGPTLWYVRVASGFIGLAFLCWPNLAFHFAGMFKRGSAEDMQDSSSGH